MIILFYPKGKEDYKYPWMPLSILALARRLCQNNFSVMIIDERVEEREIWERRLKNINPSELVYVGISCMTGRQIHYGLEFADYIRKFFPNTKIVWGGYHPTLFPEQVAGHNLADYVIAGHATENISLFSKMLKDGASEEELEKIPGLCFYKKDGFFVKNSPVKEMDLSVFLNMPLELLDIPKYINPETRRMPLISSVGCTNRCSFCYQGSRYAFISGEKTAKMVEYYVKKYNMKGFRFFDPNFFVAKHKVLEFCSEILKRGINIEWIAYGDIVALSRFSLDEFKLICKSGCISVSMGAESGSSKMLKMLNKGHNQGDLIKLAEKIKDVQISLIAGYMFGVPNEEMEDFHMTINEIRRATSIKKDIIPGAFFYTPIPAVQLQEICKEQGYKEPETLEEWGDIKLDTHDNFKENPWIDGLYTDYYRKTYQEIFGERKQL
ncbi:B12-binding domain-containing radical SAM protein [Candidatus Parcubacteria bacterium]|nr:B12-binding domain-containing radical SAM protein [Candidatus Parcubacteria bacterium]